MIKTLILDYMLFLVAGVILLFIVVKSYVIVNKGLSKNLIDLFFVSLAPISRQGIRNTFQEKVKKYYKFSNKINIYFYTLIVVLIGIYFLMKAL